MTFGADPLSVPCEGPATTANVRLFPSASVADSTIAAAQTGSVRTDEYVERDRDNDDRDYYTRRDDRTYDTRSDDRDDHDTNGDVETRRHSRVDEPRV